MTSGAKSSLLISSGLIWLAAVSSWMMASDGVSLRETRLGVVAHFLDKLPPRFSNPIFIFLWAAMLLGWTVPAALGLRRLLRSSRLKRVSSFR